MNHTLLYAVSGVAAAVSCVATLVLAYRHWVNWADPEGQRLTLQILALAPIYAACSAVSIGWHRGAIYCDAACELYEAYVLYQFLRLMVHYAARRATDLHYTSLGAKGARDCSNDVPFEERHLVNAAVRDARTLAYFEECPPLVLCRCVSIEPTGQLFTKLHWAVAQYGGARALYTVLVIALREAGLHQNRSLSPTNANLWLLGMVNVSATAAIAAILLFVTLARPLLWQHDPVLKFGSLKLVVFFVFWQSVLLTALGHWDTLPLRLLAPWTEARAIDALDNTAVCVEMALLAVYHHWIFPSDETQRTSPMWSIFFTAVPLVQDGEERAAGVVPT